VKTILHRDLAPKWGLPGSLLSTNPSNVGFIRLRFSYRQECLFSEFYGILHIQAAYQLEYFGIDRFADCLDCNDLIVLNADLLASARFRVTGFKKIL